MFCSNSIQPIKTYSIYIHLVTILILIHYIYEINGQQYDSYKWKTIHDNRDDDDTTYLPLNKMTINSLLHHNDHNNNGRKIIKTRAIEIAPPERPFIFETPEALRTYLHKLNEYFAIIGRPRDCHTLTNSGKVLGTKVFNARNHLSLTVKLEKE
ncbi:unnamed protein product [Schistosoma margrebowiei]|uniref:Uncharacterized protein n=1 Tax=Schistosoma margrebowiei TaxID=48269 RepID=A0AA85A0K9_9TREM|nr:unnamed protein product [Schistosoma margrebowiei]